MISTLGGLFNLNHFDQSSCANDVIVIRHKDGSLHSTPFNVRFGRAQMWSYVGRVVQVEVNGEMTAAVMKIGKGGEAYWLQPTYGAFGDSRHGAAPASEFPTAEAGIQSAAAAVSGVLGVKNVIGGRGEEASLVSDFGSAVQEGETLSVDEADLRHLPISSESLPTLVPSSEVHGGTWRGCKDPGAFPAPPAVSGSVKGDGGHLSSSETDVQRRHSDRDLSYEDSTCSLPLLHTADDGHLTIETRAIHSAGDAQEARLALRAMAAAEKSRKRLWKMGLGDDPYLLKAALEEGHVGEGSDDDDDDDEDHHHDHHVIVVSNPDALDIGEGDLGANPPVKPVVEIVVGAAELPMSSHGAAAGAAGGPQLADVPCDATQAAVKMKGEVSAMGDVPVPPATKPGVGEPSDTVLTPSSPQQPAEAATVASSATSVTGSTDSYKVQDGDPYFLDPLDTDGEYTALYGDEEAALCDVGSFPSSVTSGVSLNDLVLAPGTTTGDTVATVRGSTTAEEGAPRLGAERVSPRGSGAAPLLVPSTGSVGTFLESALTSQPLTGETRARDSAADIVKVPASLLGAAAVVTTGKSGVAPAADSNGGEAMDSDANPVQPKSNPGGVSGGPYFTRTLIPVQADLWKLRLREGCNAVRYLARKDSGDVVSISCNIFLWNWTDRLVVSDVDGTITKSDLLGHFYAMLGKGADWTHPGICNLYSKIEGNGYRMVYLTARSVSQIKQTKSYLFTLQQDGVRLPMGPVLTAPQRFFTALTQEVSKQSHVFKIACLSSVRAAFPATTKPFFAGFGNRYNDVISYDAAGISTQRIFIIDPSSVLHVCLVRQTYRDLGHLVDVTFPPVKRHPIVLRRPPHTHRAQGAGPNASVDRGSTITTDGLDRYAYARSLLYGSSSGSSSSSASSSSSSPASSDSSERLAVSQSPDMREVVGGADLLLAVGGAAAIRDSSDAPNVLHHHHSAHNDTTGYGSADGDGARVSRHAPAAFSLVSSDRVDMSNPMELSGVSARPCASSKPDDSGGPASLTSIPKAESEVSASASSKIFSSVATLGRQSAVAKPIAFSNASTAPLGRARNSTASVHSRWYNYTQGISPSEVRDRAHAVLAAEEREEADRGEEEMPVDPDYSSFLFWRIDPRDLITAPLPLPKSTPGPAACPATKGTQVQGNPAETVGAVDAPKTSREISAAPTASPEEKDSRHSSAAVTVTYPVPKAGSAGDPAILNAASSAIGSTTPPTLIDSGAAGVGFEGSASVPTPGGADGGIRAELFSRLPSSDRRSLTDGATSLSNHWQMRSSVSASGTVEGSPRTASELQGLQSRTPRGLEDSEVIAVSSYDLREGAAEKNAKTGESSSHPQQPIAPVSYAQPSALVASNSGGGSGSSSRGFFSAFSFGRSRAAKSPLSPTAKKAAQLLEEAKQRALAHPDASIYNTTPQLHLEQAPQLPSHQGTKSPATTKGGAAASPHK